MAGIASPRLLMCSASMGAEGSVTLQLREAVEAPDSSGQSDTTALTIGYPETELIADIQGSIQATGKLQPYTIVVLVSFSGGVIFCISFFFLSAFSNKSF